MRLSCCGGRSVWTRRVKQAQTSGAVHPCGVPRGAQCRVWGAGIGKRGGGGRGQGRVASEWSWGAVHAQRVGGRVHRTLTLERLVKCLVQRLVKCLVQHPVQLLVQRRPGVRRMPLSCGMRPNRQCCAHACVPSTVPVHLMSTVRPPEHRAAGKGTGGLTLSAAAAAAAAGPLLLLPLLRVAKGVAEDRAAVAAAAEAGKPVAALPARTREVHRERAAAVGGLRRERAALAAPEVLPEHRLEHLKRIPALHASARISCMYSRMHDLTTARGRISHGN